MTTSDRDKCGLSSLLPMSCRGRAEAFARRLHSRLRSLGSEDENGLADESSWLAGHENSIALAQPRNITETEMYLDLDLLESPGSPEDEIEDTELNRLLNNDNLINKHNNTCHCSQGINRKKDLLKNGLEKSNDSDSSDGTFYDTESDILERRLNNHVNGSTNCDSGKSEDSFITIPEASLTLTSSSEDVLTQNGFKHEHNSSSKINGAIVKDPEISQDGKNNLNTSNNQNGYTHCNGIERNDERLENEVDAKLHEIKCHNENNAKILNGIDLTKKNGIKQFHNASNGETYVSSISIEKDLTIECPTNETVAQKHQNIEIRVQNDQDDAEEQTPRVRRCSSLKTGKTPPGTPGRKKIVRFADVLGLDLADVRTFLDEIPKIPTSAYEDLRDVDLSDSSSETSLNNLKFNGIKADKLLVPLFQQPAGLINFMDQVRDNLVSLESAVVEDALMFSIKGSVRVRNLDFHKSVHIRYTFDSWKSYADVQATYVENSCDGFSDKFTFLIYAHTLTVGQRLEFAVRFQCKGCQYWDNNKGANYCFQCLPASNSTPFTPITCGDEWGASFYYQEDLSCNNAADSKLTSKAVQELIANVLEAKEPLPKQQHQLKKIDLFTVLMILLFSFLFICLQKAIYIP